jgi:succinate-semialdehyde dehydrogenase/glutarate-semialdehyde dehydrogenase
MTNSSTVLPHQNLINGVWVDAHAGRKMDVINPATGDVIGSVPHMGAVETDAAIAAAHDAFPVWSGLTAYERSKILRRWYELVMVNRENLAELMQVEAGKLPAEARAEIDYSASFIDWFAEEIKRPNGAVIPAVAANRTITTRMEPIGVAAMITPWNFPSAMVTRKVAAALAAGCTVVLKPDHRTPYSALALGVLAAEAGVTAGAFNIVTGDAAEIGNIFCTDPRVAKISFTGSTRVGRILMEQAAPTIKRLSLELGGNAPFIVCDDADIDAAVTAAMVAKFRNGGQSCVAANRFLVARGVYDIFVKKCTAAIKNIAIGPMIDAPAVDKIHALVTDAVKNGARIVAGGSVGARPNFYTPTLLVDIPANCAINKAEIFGPVMAVSPFDTDAEALARANDADVGLASYVFTRGIKRAEYFSGKLQFGMVGVNTGLISFAGAPFGGFKQSGLGREGAAEGLAAYCETKYIAVQN